MKYYIASSLNNAANVRLLRDELAFQGHEITYDWTTHGFVDYQVREADGFSLVEKIAAAEMQGIRDANYVILLQPGRLGTYFEFGFAMALSKMVYMVGDGEGPRPSFDYICPVKFHDVADFLRHSKTLV